MFHRFKRDFAKVQLGVSMLAVGCEAIQLAASGKTDYQIVIANEAQP